jgi:hypothetical protein
MAATGAEDGDLKGPAPERDISLDPQALPDAPRVPCSFCGKMIMPNATLCGFCWRRRDVPVTAGAAT